MDSFLMVLRVMMVILYLLFLMMRQILFTILESGILITKQVAAFPLEQFRVEQQAQLDLLGQQVR